MNDNGDLPDEWQIVRSPPALFRRFDFADYAGTREFLDRLADLSKETGLHPDLSFGKTHVNVTIPAGGDAPGAAELGYASRVNQLDDVT